MTKKVFWETWHFDTVHCDVVCVVASLFFVKKFQNYKGFNWSIHTLSKGHVKCFPFFLIKFKKYPKYISPNGCFLINWHKSTLMSLIFLKTLPLLTGSGDVKTLRFNYEQYDVIIKLTRFTRNNIYLYWNIIDSRFYNINFIIYSIFRTIVV